MLQSIRRRFVEYYRSSDAVAAVEAAFVFPILLTLLLGTLDMGRGIMCNQKTIKASQVIADLVTRDQTLSNEDLNEAIQAGILSLWPYDTSAVGYDIVSVRFLPDESVKIVGRETENMSQIANVSERVEPIAAANRGVVMVTVQYLYEPIFAGFVVNNIQLQETAFARGRQTEVICFEDFDCS